MNFTFKNRDWIRIIKRWWLSLLLIPFILYQIHQAYWTLNFNIFFSITYSFPFPVNVEKFLTFNFLLLVHEAGHAFFGIFGSRILTILGGSLYEILLPLIIAGFTTFNRYIKGTQLALYLFGSAWFHVAFYAADGSRHQLPLIGNLGSESHDWHNLLTHFDLLNQDETIALTFVLIGTLIYAAALTVPLWLKRYHTARIDLKL